MKTVVTDGYALNPGDFSWEPLGEIGEFEVYDRTPSELVLERCREAELIITNKVPFDEARMAALPKLRYIGCASTGYNIIDIEAAKSRGILVTNVPAYSTDSVAQHVFALLLEHCMQVGHHSRAVHEGRWVNAQDYCFWDFPLHELAGKTMGIIGFGSIGRKVAEIAFAFGMNVVANSRTRRDTPDSPHFRWADLETLCRESDVITIHCPLFPETTGLIDRKYLELMKPDVFLINTSRGPVLNEQDVADALNNGRIAGAGVDVLSTEPPAPDNPLLTAKNCFVTAHIAWATLEARRRLIDETIENALSFAKGIARNAVNGVTL